MTATGKPGLYHLLAWLSPSFPTGAFSYSHGLEAAVADGRINDRASLQAWISAIVTQGSGRLDSDLLREAYLAAQVEDATALAAANRRGLAYRATAELALESAQQGAAFAVTRSAAWPDEKPEPSPPDGGRGQGEGGGSTAPAGPRPPLARGSGPPSPAMPERDIGPRASRPRRGRHGRAPHPDEGACYAAAFGAAAARAGIALDDALLGYLQAFAANLVSAGLRLGIIGQTDGQRILAALEPAIARAAEAALTRPAEDFGSATFAVDLASMRHETQYSRLFRS